MEKIVRVRPCGAVTPCGTVTYYVGKQREIEFLLDGVTNILNPYHFFYLSTINNDEPSIRTIVNRGIDKEPFSIYFNGIVKHLWGE